MSANMQRCKNSSSLSLMWTLGHMFFPSPTIPAWPRCLPTLMSLGICCDCGLTMFASTRGPVARPYMVEGSTMYVLT